MKSKKAKRGQTVLAYVVLIFLSFLCLFFFYILIVNATRSHADLQKGFSAIPGSYFLENLKNVANDGSFPMFRGILNSLIVSSCSAALCTYFSSLTAYGLYAYDFKIKKAAFTFIMAILVMPTQVTAMGFLRLITNMGMYDSLLPLPSAYHTLYRISGCILFYVQLSAVIPSAVSCRGGKDRRLRRIQDIQPDRASDHEAGDRGAGNLLVCRIME